MRLNIVLPICLLFYGVTASVAQSETCNSAHHQVVHPFLGIWEEYTVTDSAEILIGRLSTRLDVGGCVLTQAFITTDSSFSYQSQGFLNPASNLWEETYVFNSGGHSKYLWIAEGDELYTLRVGGTRHTEYLHRLRYTDIKADEYTVIQQQSYDGGKTWESNETTRIVRIDH